MTIEINISINRSKEEVYEYWIDSKKIQLWLAEKNSATVINPKKNGKFQIYINENHNTEGCRFISINPYKEIEFSWKGPFEFDDFLNFPKELTTVKVIINAEYNKPTNIIVQHFGWKSSEDYQKARIWHQEFWKEKLDLLMKIAEI